MKRKTWPYATLILLLVTTGCSGASQSGTSQSTPPSATPTPPPAATATATASAPTSASPSVSPPSSPGDEIETQISSMSLAQKVGQMLLAGVEGTTVDKSAKRMISEDHVGGLILFKNNLGGIAGSVGLINGLKKANAGNPAPLFMSVDQEGGRVSRLPAAFLSMPANAVVGKTKDAGLAGQMGGLIAQQLKLLGFNVDFAPVLDVNSNPKNPVIGDRSFGSTAELVTNMGLAEMKGIRGGGIIPVVKHFPGHGDTAVDSHLDLPVVQKTAAQLERMEWVPFKAAIESDAEAVMVAHILFPRIDPDAPASFSKVIIGDHLRGRLGYNGVVITDDLTMGAIVKNYGIAEAAVRSVEAGSDILLVAHGYDTAHQVFMALMNSVASGRVPESRIDQSVARILKLKQKYHLTDHAVPVPKSADLPNNEIRRWLNAVNTG
jgi:beta-N-acetylhexosaminidase